MGLSVALMAQYIGIADRTWHKWRARGEEDSDGPYRDIVAAVARGEAEGALAALSSVIKAYREGDWKAAAWMLERRHGYRSQPKPQPKPAEAVTETGGGSLAAMLGGGDAGR